MNEQDLYKAIVEVWGEYGAHADIYRELCKRAGFPIGGPVTAEKLAREAKAANPDHKLQAVKQFRDEYENNFGIRLDLKASVKAFEDALIKGE